MTESVSVPAAPTTERAATDRFRLRVPTPVIVTLLGAALSVWLAPAFSRQWEDRQHARDLKAALAEDMVGAAARAIRAGVPLAEGRGRADAIVGTWLEAGLRVSVKQKAYFARPVVHRWQGVVQDVRYFLIVSENIASIHERSRPAAVDYRHLRLRDDLKLLAPTTTEADSAALLLASGDPSARALGMDEVKSWTLAKVEVAADEVLSAHPSGFSTTRGDLLHDLLP